MNHRRKLLGLASLALAGFALGCGDSDSPTTPSVVTAPQAPAALTAQ